MRKKISILFLLIAFVASSLLSTNIAAIQVKANEDLVEVVETAASTFYADSNNAAKAFDHNAGTRWTSTLSLNDANKNEQYLQAKLKEETALDRVEITWFTPWVNAYEIQISQDGQSWSKAAVSSVVSNGTEIDQEGAEYLKQKVTIDPLDGKSALYVRVAMTDVDLSKGTYLSVVDIRLYAEETQEQQLNIEKPILHNIGSYGQNTEDKMVDGTTDSAGNRWTSSNLQMSTADVLNASIEFTFENPVELTRFEVDWFNTPVTKYSISISDSDDGTFEKVVDNKTMPASDMDLNSDKITHTVDQFAEESNVKRVLLSFDDATDGGYLSICEVRAYGIVQEEKKPWEINLIDKDATATASSVQSAGMEGDKAIDGNQNTRWASSFGEQPSYLLIDLKDEVSFDQMKIYQEASYGKAFNVEVSLDGQVFSKVYETNNGQVGMNDFYFGDEIKARYVKINFTEYGLYTAYSVWEVELFKNGAQRMFDMVAAELSVPEKISTDFTLPAAVKNMKVNWQSSSDLLAIDEDGHAKVTIPETNTPIQLTAYLQYGDQQTSVVFNSMLLSKDNRQVDYQIYPIPQKMTLGDSNVELDQTVHVVLSPDAEKNQSLIDRIDEVFEENGYILDYTDQMVDNETNLLIGVNGDGSIADRYVDEHQISKEVFSAENEKYDKHLVSLDDEKNIVILAQDTDTAYYGLATLDLMFESAQSETFFGSGSKRMTSVLIEDYADMQYRGVIEGFYGWPWSFEDRLSFAEFAKRYKLNYYAYGPKSDPYHLSKWNEEYPTSATITEEEKELGVMTQEEFKLLIETFDNSNIDFVWSIHPAMGDNKIDFNDPQSIAEGQEKIMEKYASMYDLGVRQFGLFVDDIDLGVAYNNRVHIADLVDNIQNALYDKWGRALDDETNEEAVRPLMFVPSHYFLTFGDSAQNEASIREFARVNEDVIITFTGSGCWSSVVESDAETFAQRAGRDPLFWWNYSTNDVMDDQLFTDKADSYYSMNKDVKSLYGFVSNPMNEAELSKISLFGIADYAWNVEDFDSSRDYDAYFEMAFDDAAFAKAYQNVAINLDKNGKSLSSEKELFNRILDAYKKDEMIDPDDRDALRSYAANLLDSLQMMEQLKTSDNKEDQNLYDEMLPWLNKLNDMAEMTLTLCDYLDEEDPAQEWNIYAEQLLQLDAFKTDDQYAFISLELNVSNAQSSYLRNVVSPNEPLLAFIEGMNDVMKTHIAANRDRHPELITNVDAYKQLAVYEDDEQISLNLEGITLAQNEYVGIAFNKIFQMKVNFDELIEQGVTVEYSLNGKEWQTEAEDFAYVRIINKNREAKDITGIICVAVEACEAVAETNMAAYDTNSIDKIVDGDLKTKFWKAGNQAKGDSITIEYEEIIDLNDLGFYFDSANGALTDVPVLASVQISANGTDWETIAEIKKEEIQAIEDGLYYLNIDDIEKKAKYVRYLIEEPTADQWFRLVEVKANENLLQPQVTVDGQADLHVNDGDLTTYTALAMDQTLMYQVIENQKVNTITLLAVGQANADFDAEVQIYASRSNYPYHNEWISLGSLQNGTTVFDVSNVYNLQKISVKGLDGIVNIFDLQLDGDPYVDDARLKAHVDQALAAFDELEALDLDAYTVLSATLFEEKLLDYKNQLAAYKTEEEVEAVLSGLETIKQVLVEKGDGSNLQTLCDEASQLDPRYYTEDSYHALSDALKEADQLLADIDNADQQTIDTMIEKVNQAIDALKFKDGDYSKVEAAIKQAEGLDEDAYKDFSAVKEAIAQVNYGLDIRNQEAIDQMARDILNAIHELELKDIETDVSGDDTENESDPSTAVYDHREPFAAVAGIGLAMIIYLYFKRKSETANHDR